MRASSLPHHASSEEASRLSATMRIKGAWGTGWDSNSPGLSATRPKLQLSCFPTMHVDCLWGTALVPQPGAVLCYSQSSLYSRGQARLG